MFAPLRIITSYSFLKSAIKIEDILKAVKKFSFAGAAISDNKVLYGVPSFAKAMSKSKYPYLVGIEVPFESNSLVVYAINEDGYRNIIKLNNLVNKSLDLTIEDLKNCSNGAAVVLETNYGRFKEEFDKEKSQDFYTYYAKLSKVFSAFYLGIEVTNKEEFKIAQQIREFAKERHYETIAFPRIRYVDNKDAIVIKMLEAIDKGEKITISEEKGEQHFHNFEFYSKIYTKFELDNTVKLLKKSTFVYEKKRGELAKFDCSNSSQTLKDISFNELKKRNLDDEKHIARLNHELNVINEMGYADYFLIVSDYVKYAKNHDILVGPGRGSSAGSLVAYLTDITEVDPFDYDLQFERFLNKARQSMPDIDVDFMDTKRDQVFEYIKNKYGNEKVANIVAFQTIQAKQALRDIGRIYDIPTRHIDLLCKSIPDKANLREAYKNAPQFKNLVDSDKYFLDIVSKASKLEGLPRQAGQHAAGVILNNTSLEESLPVTIDLDNNLTSQYEKDYLEEQGFLKMDLLSIRNLTAIDYCLHLIEKNKGEKLSFYSIPYKNKECFDLIRSGQTIGLFQIESKGMRNAIKIIKPQEFIDVVTLLSIFRPGPMDNIKDYALKKKNKDKIKYLSESLKEILAPTYGILIYQEQVSKIASSMADFSMEEADLFRRAISHKDKNEIASNKNKFIAGAIANGYKKEDATEMFDRIEKFGDYGFNKSHAVVYAIVACRMAWLKVHYPLEFYCSILTISTGTTDHKLSDYVSEIKSRKYQMSLPDINRSNKDFIVLDNTIVMPLTNIKGLTEIAIDKLLNERMENGSYLDYFDFVSRAYHLGISDVMINKLIDAGALDSLYPSRASMRNTLRYALQLAELSYDKNGQLILDATLDNQKQFFTDIDDPLENLNLEYEVLGINLSDNPLRYKKDILKANNVVSISEVSSTYGRVNVAGIISQVKTIKVRKNNSTMAFVKIFDESGELEVTVFAKTYETTFNLLVKNNIILVKGRYDHDRDDDSFVADEISLLEE